MITLGLEVPLSFFSFAFHSKKIKKPFSQKIITHLILLPVPELILTMCFVQPYVEDNHLCPPSANVDHITRTNPCVEDDLVSNSYTCVGHQLFSL